MILVVGLSPAWQRTLVFEEIIPGKVNRATGLTETASGKGVNVARVASILGADVKLLTIAGGRRGQLLKAQLKRQGLNARVVSVNAETRICQTLLHLRRGGSDSPERHHERDHNDGEYRDQAASYGWNCCCHLNPSAPQKRCASIL